MLASRGRGGITAWSETSLRAVGVLLGLLLMLSAARPAAAAELVMFVDTGCPWCLRWDREVGEAYPRSDEGQRAPLRRLHISAARGSGLRLAQTVTVTPTFVLVEGGVEVGRITGYPGADFFWGMLGELMARLPDAATPRPRDAVLPPSGGRGASRAIATSAPPMQRGTTRHGAG